MTSRFVLRRSVIGIGQLVVLLVLVFVLSLLLPGDAADVRSNDILGPDQRAAARHLLGLDVAPAQRFTNWLGHAVTGDFGVSYASGRDVGSLIAQPFLMTGLVAVLALALLVPVAVTAGFAAGLRPGSVRDRVITSISIGLDSIPDFVLAVLLVTYVAVDLRLLPATFVGTDPHTVLTRPEYLVLPLIVMVARVAAPLVRLVRSGVVDVLDQPYVRQARRLGVRRGSLLIRHVAPNALGPALQELGRTGDGLLSGVLIVEAVFVMPGVASELIGAIGNRDDPVILAIVLITGVLAIVVNLGIDLLGGRMVPRSREGVGG
ncbi:ABC transporter permease [Nocardia macrotermitis]|uniref:Glutathione transport system permease protein GsiC n=1 Tax=Nocardia macrotermitis TaxID=2585198 RepID=A0A7K0CU28_9NOCA|nr:ABC transporter permease [Nocardia macrotermitis]MQY16980.1 Glutathione transport system permease protein GsiC [Nocardia macrotermitis]